jgi:phosphatidylglycerophosphate synthase
MDATIAANGIERTGFKDATRVLTSILSPLEKRCLIWLAQRMPRRINSDHLTGLALLAMLGAGLSYWFASLDSSWFPSLNPWAGLMAVNVCLALNWFGDSLDGTLARVRQHQRPRYGFYVDHIVDAFGILFLVGGMSLSGFMSPYVGLALLVAYFMLSIEVYLATYSLGTFKITYFKVGPTELRILLALGNLVLLVKPTATIFGQTYPLFDVGGVVATAGLMVTLVVSTIGHTPELYRAEPIPRG